MPVIDTSSLIPMPREAVIATCNATIQRIIDHRAKEDNKTVSSFMNEHNVKCSKWYYRIFGYSKPIDFETARKTIGKIKKSDCWAYMDYPSIYAWGSLKKAEALLAACNATNEPIIYVSSNDWSYIA